MIVAMKKYTLYCITALLGLSLLPVQAVCAVPSAKGADKAAAAEETESNDITLIGIPVSYSPIGTAYSIMEQIRSAKDRVEKEKLLQEEQLARLEELLRAQQDALDTESISPWDTGLDSFWPYPSDQGGIRHSYLQDPAKKQDGGRKENEAHPSLGEETEAENETETEIQTEAETQFHPTEIETMLPDTGKQDGLQSVSLDTVQNASPDTAQNESSDMAQSTSPDTAQNESSDTAQNAPMDTAHNETRHGAFSLVTVNGQNEARISLYDYRMLRAFPLPRLPKDFHALREQLEKQLAAYDGTWSVYVQNLNTGQELIVNDRPMRSASVMKLFIMETVYEAFERGDLPRNEDTVYLLRTMIINSSNESSNRLLTLLGDGDLALGVARVNELIRLRGYSDGTRQFNGFEDPNASLDPDHPNQITAKDVGLLLGRIYNRTFLSRRVCNEIEQMMLDQATRYKIPRGLPEGEGAQCGNKSGETDTIANDAAVIYGPTTDYILIVLSNDWSNEDTANAQIAEVSKTVYNFFEHV